MDLQNNEILSFGNSNANEKDIKTLHKNVNELETYFGEVKAEQKKSIKQVRRDVEKLEEDVSEVTRLVIQSLQDENEKLRRTLKYLTSTNKEAQQQLESYQQNDVNYPQIDKLVNQKNYSYSIRCSENIRNAYEDDCTASRHSSQSYSSSFRTQSISFGSSTAWTQSYSTL